MQKKILIIDDDQDILDLAKWLLETKGYEVVLSLTPDKLDYLNDIKPDLILLDNWLNGASGYECCKILKESNETRHFPVIMFSATMGLEQTAKNCNADCFIEKPFDIHHFYEVIGSFFLEATGD